jgi:hypothetical protein
VKEGSQLLIGSQKRRILNMNRLPQPTCILARLPGLAHLNLSTYSKPAYRSLAKLIVTVLATLSTVRATPITWTNAAGGNWNVASNWSPNQVPASTDNAYITNSGNYTVTLNASATVASFALGGASGTQSFAQNVNTLTLNGASTVGSNASFNLGGGTVNGPGGLTMNGTFNWSGGTIANSGGVTLYGSSSFSSAVLNGLQLAVTVTNAGSLTWGGSGTNLYFNTGTLTNLAAGTITIANDVSDTSYFGLIGNAGVVIKAGTSGTTTFNTPFVNSGSVQLQSGILSLNGGGTESGLLTNAAGTTLNFIGGTHTVVAGCSVTGAGTLLINGGTVNFNSLVATPVPNLTLTGGVLGGTGLLAVNGPFNWSGGIINNTGGATLNGASGFNNSTLNGLQLAGLLINAGTLTWGGSGTNLYFNSGTLTNLAAGTINILADVSDTSYFGQLGNAGVISKAGTSGTTTFNTPLVNNGAVQLSSGTLNLNGGGTESGLLTNAPGTTLNFTGGTHAVLAGCTVTGTGTLLISAATVNFNSLVPTALPNLTLTGGVLGGTGLLAVNGPFNWSGGILANTGGVTFYGVSSFNSSVLNGLQFSGLLINAGTINWNGSGTNLYFNTGTLTNLAAGTININADVSDTSYFGLLGNAGVISKAGTSGTTTFNTPLVNSGAVQLSSGTLNLNGGGTESGLLTNAPGTTLNFTGGTHAVLAGCTVTGTGTLLISAATVNFNNLAQTSVPNLTLTGGILGGTGLLAVNGPFNWSGGTIVNTGGVTLNGPGSFNSVALNGLTLSGLILNAGILSWSGSGTNLYLNTGTLTNLAAGTINISADVSENNYFGLLGNAGVISKAGTSGATTFNTPFVNSGTMQLSGGTLNLNGGSTESGQLTNAAGTILNFTGGTHTVLAGCTVTGTGSLVISAATVNFNSLAQTAVPNLTFTGGTLGGNGLLAVNGPFNWSGGSINNIGGVTLNGSSSFNSAAFDGLTLSGLLMNTGTLTWSGSGTNFYINQGTLTNLAAGMINITADVSANNYFGLFGNAGRLTKTGTSGITTLLPTFVNTGTLDAQSGTISLAGTYTLTKGTFNFGLNSLLNYGQINLAGSATLTGTVSANLNNGYIPIATNVFTVLTYGSKTGLFTNTLLPFADAWQTNYTTTNFTLTALNARPILFTGSTAVKELTTLTTNVVTDLDVPPQGLTSSLVSAPNGMSINPATGVITWTPAQTNSPSTNTITVVTTDNGYPPLSATNIFTVVVVEVNVPPVPPVPGATNINDLALLTVINTAFETNIHSSLSYQLVNPPGGAGISSNGIITWTPGLSQGPSTNLITSIVTNFNPYDLVNPSYAATNSFTVIVFAPTLAPIGNYTANCGQPVSFTASATDNDSTRTLSFGLGSSPVGAAIVPASGFFNWRPPVATAGSSNIIQVIVTDNSTPTLSATQSFYVQVNPLTPVTMTPMAKTATQFQLQVTGPVGPDYILQENGSLVNGNWVNLMTNTPGTTSFSMVDTSMSTFSNRFYRIVLAP